MQLQTTSRESKFPNEYIGVIFIQIDQHLKKLLKKYKGVPILWNMVYWAKINDDDDYHDDDDDVVFVHFLPSTYFPPFHFLLLSLQFSPTAICFTSVLQSR